MFSEDNMEMKRDSDIPLSNYIKLKESMWVSYNFKETLDYSLDDSSSSRSIYFWCHDTTLLSIKKNRF